MDKTKLKRKIKNFATNCAMAATMFILLGYAMIMWSGGDTIWLLICDIICFAGDVFFATNDWKEIKQMLGDSENV